MIHHPYMDLSGNDIIICPKMLSEFETDESFASTYCRDCDHRFCKGQVPAFPCLPSIGKNKFFQCITGHYDRSAGPYFTKFKKR